MASMLKFPRSSPFQKARMFSDNSGPYNFGTKVAVKRIPLVKPENFSGSTGASMWQPAIVNNRMLPGQYRKDRYQSDPWEQYATREGEGTVGLGDVDSSWGGMALLAGGAVLAYMLLWRK